MAFAAMLGLSEGPAQATCALALLTTLLLSRRRALELGWVGLGLLLWVLAGLPGLLGFEVARSSGEVTRPLMALATIVGARGLGEAKDDVLARCAWAFGIGITINAAYGLLQTVVGPLPLDRLLLTNPDSPQIWIPTRVFHERAASGLFYNRLKLAHVGAVGFGLCGTIALSAGRSRRARIAALVAMVVVVAAMVLTYARMALLGSIVAALVLALIMLRGRVLALASVAALAGGLALSLTEFGSRRIESLGRDLADRRTIFRAALEVFREAPVFGVGHGGYRGVVEAHANGLSGALLTNPHNLWLQVLAETGVVGFLGFTFAMLAAIFLLGRRVRRHRLGESMDALLDRSAFFGLIVIVAIGATHFSIHHAPVALLYFLCVGVALRRPEGRGASATAE